VGGVKTKPTPTSFPPPPKTPHGQRNFFPYRPYARILFFEPKNSTALPMFTALRLSGKSRFSYDRKRFSLEEICPGAIAFE